MEVDNIPVIGRVHKTMTTLTVNFSFLGLICVVLGLAIILFPKVLEVLVATLLIVMGMLFFSIAHSVHSYKKKGFKIFEE